MEKTRQKTSFMTTAPIGIDWGKYFEMYENIEYLEVGIQHKLLTYFIPLLECFCGEGWRQFVLQTITGEVTADDLKDSLLLHFLCGVDFNYLIQLCPRPDRDGQLLEKFWTYCTT